jgi:hypothetical protein
LKFALYGVIGLVALMAISVVFALVNPSTPTPTPVPSVATAPPATATSRPPTATAIPPTVAPTVAPTQPPKPIATTAPKPAGASAKPSGGACPATHPVKGNRSGRDWIYHVQGGRSYNQTNPEECFATPADATAAGYRAAQN